MKQLSTYLCESLIYESTFSTADWGKENHTYGRDVIDKLVSGNPIRLGDKGTDGEYVATSDEISKLQSLEVDYTKDSLKQFNSIFDGKLNWTQIFKGDFSGYVNGLASKNKGNAFEEDYINNFELYKEDLAKCLKVNIDDFDGCVPESWGGQNQSRPLTQGRNGLVIGGKHETVGESVVDVLVKDVNGTPYNLSLKYGKSVTFCNAGVSRLFTKKSFMDYKKTGKYEPDCQGNVCGSDLLDMFCIDRNKFAEVFESYGKKHSKDYVDITKELSKNKGFEDFIESVVGYNYILVHKIGKNVHYYDLRTPNDMKKFIGRLQSAEIQYGGSSGDGKRIDILVETTGLSLKFNIRSKDGGLYPTHLMSDYEIK